MLCCWSPPISKTKSLELAQTLGAERQSILEFSEQSITRNLSDHHEKILEVTDRALSYIEQNSHKLRKLHRSVRLEANRDISAILTISRENLNYADPTQDVLLRMQCISRIRDKMKLKPISEYGSFHLEASSNESAKQRSESNFSDIDSPLEATL